MARAGLEGQTRPALARQEARAEPAAWQAARVAPAGQEAWAAPARRGALAAQGRPPGQQRALEQPPGLEGWKKHSFSSSSVS